LGTIAWLNRENTAWPLVAGGAAVTAAALALALLLSGRGRTIPLRVAGVALLGGLVLGLVGADRFNRRAYPLPTPREPPVVVGFDLQYSDLNIPAFELPGGMRSFHTFYTWTQRLGFVP